MARNILLLAMMATVSLHAGVVYSVTVDTSNFDTGLNPYELDINLTAANGTGDNSSVTIGSFSCIGCPGSSQTLTDAAFTQDLYIPFGVGGTVAFDLSLSPDLSRYADFGPDSFQLSILDNASTPVVTTDAFDAVLFSQLDSDFPDLLSFGSLGEGAPQFAAPTVTLVSGTPEPGTALLCAGIAGFLLLHRRYGRSG
jgi:hypothetical protein